MKVDKLLGFIISHPKIDHFSALEIRTAYLLLSEDDALTAVEARKKVYAQLLKLVRKGWLRKHISEKKSTAYYIKTELFMIDHYEYANSISYITSYKQENEIHTCDEALGDLYAKLNDYKSDLIEGLGEVEEYRTIRTELPELHDNLTLFYNNARESNSRLLGKIKAIETLISKLSSEDTK